jgi:hypothetical protein
VDAFSSDAIPVHLLTREAFALYFTHLQTGGVLAVHISNKYLDLEPVVEKVAKALGKPSRVVDTEDDESTGAFGSTWILLTDRTEFFDKPEIKRACARLRVRPGLRMWTDDYSNLVQILK